jgi:hypothetical protein
VITLDADKLYRFAGKRSAGTAAGTLGRQRGELTAYGWRDLGAEEFD